MKSFYHHMMSYRGKKPADDAARLADWMFHDHDFPKHSLDYDEISRYLEWNSPFSTALSLFDELWAVYQSRELS
ncbi:YozE family protein [Lentibacillus saliphilus]|uniref:YozE family protein n=1 Tax=Lentibacillus saliphilus TaxID=2737028 RepID=UPI001C30A07F|nr:YozE family protein [Lentibacillus saliphilus]